MSLSSGVVWGVSRPPLCLLVLGVRFSWWNAIIASGGMRTPFEEAGIGLIPLCIWWVAAIRSQGEPLDPTPAPGC